MVCRRHEFEAEVEALEADGLQEAARFGSGILLFFRLFLESANVESPNEGVEMREIETMSSVGRTSDGALPWGVLVLSGVASTDSLESSLKKRLRFSGKLRWIVLG